MLNPLKPLREQKQKACGSIWNQLYEIKGKTVADQDGGPKAAIHSEFAALDPHPCVALSSDQASLLYGRCCDQKRENHPFR